MKQLDKKELQGIRGGAMSLSLGLAIAAGIVFVIGVIDGYIRPLPCR